MRFHLNGREVDVQAPAMKRLLDVLREDCGLTGTKEGCGEGECGSCTVLLEGEPVCSCLVPFGQVAGARVMTVEGIPADHPLLRHFVEQGATQCGACTPGFLLTAYALGSRAAAEEVRAALAGNLCRCTGYQAIYRSIKKARA